MGEIERSVSQFEDLPESVRDDLTMLDMPGVRPAKRERVLSRVARDFPGYVPAQLNLAAARLELGRAEEAEELYREVQAKHPSEAGARAGLATVLAETGRLDEAERLAEEALAAGYAWPPCYEVLAQARRARGDLKGAAEAYLTAYEMSPHAWNYLEQYCSLTGSPFHPPTGEVPTCITREQLRSLLDFIDHAAGAPEEHGGTPGCDHTLRFSRRWAERNGVDFVNLYQYLNGHGGFCDCEVGFNVSSVLDD